jgi:hypothetical protein
VGGSRLKAGQKRKRKGCGLMRCGRGAGRAGVGREGGLKHCEGRMVGGGGCGEGEAPDATRGGGSSSPIGITLAMPPCSRIAFWGNKGEGSEQRHAAGAIGVRCQGGGG